MHCANSMVPIFHDAQLWTRHHSELNLSYWFLAPDHHAKVTALVRASICVEGCICASSAAVVLVRVLWSCICAFKHSNYITCSNCPTRINSVDSYVFLAQVRPASFGPCCLPYGGGGGAALGED